MKIEVGKVVRDRGGEGSKRHKTQAASHKTGGGGGALSEVDLDLNPYTVRNTTTHS